MNETLYQGAKDIFLSKVRADFDAVEDQALKSSRQLTSYSLVGTESMSDVLFTRINEASGAVWRHVGTAGVKNLGNRRAGGVYPEVEFIRTYETAVFDPDQQTAGEFRVPDERNDKEGAQYKTALDRAKKLLIEIDRDNVKDPFEIFNLAFSAPSVYPTRFFVRGNMGLDGNNTPLAERLISIQHARADGGATWSNAVQSSGNARAFDDDAYWAAREQGASLVDDVGKPYPAFGGRTTLVVPPANGMVRLAKELDESEWKTNVANNDINIHQGMFTRVVSSPYLLASAYVTGVANTSAWFMVDDGMRDPQIGTGMVCITFVPLQSNTYYDDAHDSVVYKVKQEHVYGWLEPRAILGSKGDGAAYSS